ncbi:hypothetical protein GJAV_G00149770 [Gymnothorax javanicus]|nr:hypothetical protein GJAV_G00149770 [Gymnothorax javanicus]
MGIEMEMNFGFCILMMVFLSDFLMIKVHGDGLNNEDKTDFKYAVIGACIGVFFSLCFLAVKLYMLRKHMFDNGLSGEKNIGLFIQIGSHQWTMPGHLSGLP